MNGPHDQDCRLKALQNMYITIFVTYCTATSTSAAVVSMNFKLGSINQIPGERLQYISHLVFLTFDGFIKSIRLKGTFTHCIHRMTTLHFV